MLRKVIALVACVFLHAPANGGSSEKLYSSKDWALYKSDVHLGIEKDAVLLLENMCSARTGNKDAMIIVSILPGMATTVQIASTKWNWPGRNRDVFLQSDGVTVQLEDALYWDDFIDHMTTPENGGSSLVEMLASKGDRIQVLDHRKKLIAIFSNRGLAQVLDRTKKCAKNY